MFRILLRLLRTHGISKGANMAKNLGFSSKDILKAKEILNEKRNNN